MKKLRDGRKYIIRDASVKDAEQMIAYLDKIATESDNLTFGPGEIDIKLEDEIKIIESAFSSTKELFIVAEVDGLIIANLTFRAGKRPRLEHTGEFGISVLKEFWGNGIGKALLHSLIEWAQASPVVRKVNLRVREDNEKAIALYEKMGFQREGLILRDMLIGEEFTNSVCMGLLID